MSSFRRYGGMDRAATSNIVHHQYSNEAKLSVTEQVGLYPLSRTVFANDLDMSNNHIFDAQTVAIGKFNVVTPYVLDVSGQVHITGNLYAANVNSSSDYRLKENILPISDSTTVDRLNPIIYNMISTKEQQFGFLAHELQQEYPFLVTGEKDGTEMQSVNYIGLIALLVKEIQDLKKRLHNNNIL